MAWCFKSFVRWTSLLFLVSSPSLGDGLKLKPGGYAGKSAESNERVELYLKALDSEGRPESFFGVLINYTSRRHPQVNFYLVDPEPTLSSVYVLAPWSPAEDDGNLGPTNYNDHPTLTLQISGKTRRGNLIFRLGRSNAPNQAGFQGIVHFNGRKRPRYEWTDYTPGTYRLPGHRDRHAAIFPNLSTDSPSLQTENEVDLNSPAEISGRYIQSLRLDVGFYAYQQSAWLNTGNRRELVPRVMGIFLKNRTGRTFFLMVYSFNDTETYLYKRRVRP